MAKRRLLAPLREKLKELTDRANNFVQRLKLYGVSEQSRALEEARRTAIRFHSEEEGKLFNYDLPRSRDIGRELARVSQFLNDATSTPEGVKREGVATAQSLFGGQYRANGGYGANPDEVDEDTARRVFEIYHKALEAQGGYERVMGWLKQKYTGLEDYGSENLINAIYSMVKQEPSWKRGRESTKIDDYAAKASKLIEEMIDEAKRVADLQQMGYDYGIMKDAEKEQRLRRALWRRTMDEIERRYNENR